MAAADRHSALATVYAVQHQLQSDESCEFAELHKRDRAIALEREVSGAAPLAQLRAWASALQSERIGRIAAAERTAAAGTSAAGFLLGAALAAGVLYYDGSQPVNIVRAISVLVVLPVLLLLCTAALMLPERLRELLPGARLVADAAASLHPARLRSLFARLAPAEVRQQLEETSAFLPAHRAIFGPLHRWTMVYTGQLAGVFFSLGVLCYCAAAIVFTDLAFVWSTTLQVDPEQFHRAAEVWSLPWAGLFPNGVPSRELVEGSRFYRYGGGAVVGAGKSASAAALGGWWPFLVLSVVTYVLLPRLALAVVAAAVRKRIALRLLVRLPGVDLLRSRMDRELISTQAVEPESTQLGAEASVEGGKPQPLHLSGDSFLLIWARQELNGEEVRRAAAVRHPEARLQVMHVGGRAPAEDDRRAAAVVRSSSSAVIALLVRAWEPPTAEVFDFIAELRAAAGADALIQIVPLGAGGLQGDAEADSEHLQTWVRRTAREGDPWLKVRCWRGS